MKNLNYFLKLAKQNDSIPEETAEDWAEWVARPVLEHNFAPRQARAILEIVGRMLSNGENINDIINLLLTISRMCSSVSHETNPGISASKARKGLKNILTLLLNSETIKSHNETKGGY